MSMKKQITLLTILFASLSSAHAQSLVELDKQVKQVEKGIEVRSAVPSIETKAVTSDDVKYAYPNVNFSLEGSKDGGVYTNYLSFNRDYNPTGIYLIAPKASVLNYFDMTEGEPTSSLWTAPGGVIVGQNTDRDIDVRYEEPGVFDFPTMNMELNGAQYTYQAPEKLKISGRAEISLSDMREVNKTFKPTYLTYDQAKYGWASGSNGRGFEGFGNIFCIGNNDAILEGVSVYCVANPTSSDPNRELVAKVYIPTVTKDDFNVSEDKLLGSATLKFSDIIPNADSKLGISAVGEDNNPKAVFGLAQFKFEQPISVPSTFFISISNFGNNLQGGDKFIIYVDGMAPNLIDSKSVMSFTSFVYNTNVIGLGMAKWLMLNSYHPADVVGTDNATLMICPIINYGDAESSISKNQTIDMKAYLSGDELIVTSDKIGLVSVYDIMGNLLACDEIDSRASIPAGSWSKGIYMVNIKSADGSTRSLKIIK